MGSRTAFSPVFNTCKVEARGFTGRRAEIYGHFGWTSGCAYTLGQSSTSCSFTKWIISIDLFVQIKNQAIKLSGHKYCFVLPMIHGKPKYKLSTLSGVRIIVQQQIDFYSRITPSELPQSRSGVCLGTGSTTPVEIESIASSTGLSSITRACLIAVCRCSDSCSGCNIHTTVYTI